MAGVDTYLFVGPTLAPCDVPDALGAVCLPPVRQGDVYRVVSLLRPRAIGIIDGYFQWVPAVWHKEILWAIDQGVHVFGASSMGALRAAELAVFGMRGVGLIFEAYRDGRLGDDPAEPFEDDDEVAVVHGPPELGYPALSDAMVNIRCTLARAQAQGVISESTRARLVAIAKSQFFAERSFALLLEQARGTGLNPKEMSALESWLPQGRVDQKRMDAVAMIEAMQRFLATDPPAVRASFTFERTSLWQRVVAQAQSAARQESEEDWILDELRLQGDPYGALRRESVDALMPAGSRTTDATRELEQQLLHGHRTPTQVDSAFASVQRISALLQVRANIDARLIERQMLARLSGTDTLTQLRARAMDKMARLTEKPPLPEPDDFPELKLLQLRDWYFSRILGADMPDDLGQCISDWGYTDVVHFHRTLLREFAYREMNGSVEANGDASRAGAELR